MKTAAAQGEQRADALVRPDGADQDLFEHSFIAGLRNEPFAAFGPAAGKDFPAVGGGHAPAESVLSFTDDFRRGFKVLFHGSEIIT